MKFCMQHAVKKLLIVFGSAGLLLACGQQSSNTPVVVSPAPLQGTLATAIVRIGHAGPTSGPIAHLGKDNENGARLAIDELNTAGVVIDGKSVTLELMTEDDAADPKQGTAVAQ